MKKFYCLFLMAAVALSASAYNLNLTGKTLHTGAPDKTEVTKAKKSTKQKIGKSADNSSLKIRGARKADASSSIEGLWTFLLGDYYFEESVGMMTAQFVATLDGDEISFEDPTDNELPFFGTYDAATGIITFDLILLGQVDGFYVFQYPFVYNEGTGQLDGQSIQAQYNADNGEIEFEVDNGIAWPASRDGSNIAGYFAIYDLLYALQVTEEEVPVIDEEQIGLWKSIGNATFLDGWALPGWGEDPADYPYPVELQQSVENENLYRLWQPYYNSPLYGYNISNYLGQIVFDVSDPDHVIVYPGYPAGYKDDYDNQETYNFNLLGWQIHMFGENYSDEYYQVILDFMEENGQPFDTYKDGVVTINRPVFDTTGACENALSWNVVYPAQIIFPTGSDDGDDNVEMSGTMTSQLDMMQGMSDQPQLEDPETYQVTATFNKVDNTLTINNFNGLNPVEFTVNLQTGEAVAEEQLAEIDKGEDYEFYYYYADLGQSEIMLTAQVLNLGDKQTKVTVSPWGELLVEFDYFNTAYYNTVVVLNGTIPGLVPSDNNTNGITRMEGNDDAVRFFNLQGVEIANPQRGDILIKVAGGKASKVII